MPNSNDSSDRKSSGRSVASGGLADVGTQDKHRVAQRLAPYIVFLGTLALTISLWTYAARTASNRDAERFESEAFRNRFQIESKLRDQAIILQGIGAIFTNFRFPTLREFDAVVSASLDKSIQNGASGAGFAPWVTSENASPWNAQGRLINGPTWKIFPPTKDRVQLPLLYASPRTANTRYAIGYDSLTSEDRRDAILTAVETASIAATGVVTLVSDQKAPRPSVVLFLPVYDRIPGPKIVSERKKRVIGLVYSPIRLDNFFADVEVRVLSRSVAMEAYDSDGKLIYRSPKFRSGARFKSKQMILVGNRRWMATFASTTEFEQDLSGRYVPLVPFLGVLISGLLFSLSLAQRNSKDKAVEQAALLEREVVERTRAEQEVRRLNEGLESLVKARTQELEAANAELQSFVYSVSHDLRTPLRTVDGFSHALIADYGETMNEEALDYVGRVRRAAKRMDELITALLSLSRITRTELIRREVNISLLAEELAAEYRRVSDWQIEFEIESGMTAYADERLMTAVLDNLIGNAVKFSQNEPSPKVEVGMSNGNFFVRDNGVGFDPTHAGKLFKPFERLHSVNEFPGTGIGLATVLRIISRHGGEMWAESELGKGATFYFHLPNPAGTLSS